MDAESGTFLMKLPMQAGKLRHQFDVQTKTQKRNGIALGKPEWTTIDTISGSIEPVDAKDFTSGQQGDSLATHKITIRFYEGLTTSHRFLFGTREFDIEGKPMNFQERNRMMTVMVKETT